MHVKICGLTRAQDALLARKLGAWALGFIFFEGSKRNIAPESAREIIAQLPKPAPTIGVFVNQTDRAIETAKALGLNGIQLHGDETPEDCRRARQETGCFVIKALRAKSEDDVARIGDYRGAANYILLDAAAADGSYGGTGEKADWSLAARAVREYPDLPFILAGGIKADNIAEALAAVQPYALDLSSGVESAPGVKDANKLAALFAAAKGADDDE
ncbi:MAG: phosphoribosylanthranilate isomerase [Alphaproteobacteria bacterium]|nr:phosphoribosylanthranilate isomerase [Alphaproteobacteria bacterium]